MAGWLTATTGAFSSAVVPALLKVAGWELDGLSALTARARAVAEHSSTRSGSGAGEAEGEGRGGARGVVDVVDGGVRGGGNGGGGTVVLFHPQDGVIPLSASLGQTWLRQHQQEPRTSAATTTTTTTSSSSSSSSSNNTNENNSKSNNGDHAIGNEAAVVAVVKLEKHWRSGLDAHNYLSYADQAWPDVERLVLRGTGGAAARGGNGGGGGGGVPHSQL